MNLSSPKTAWQLTLLVSAALLIAIIGYSTRSVIHALHGADPTEAAAPAPTTQEQAAVPATPGSSEATPAEAALPPSGGAAHDFSKDFEIMRQREKGRKELIENLRKQAQEHPNEPGTLSKESLDKLEKSGDSLM